MVTRGAGKYVCWEAMLWRSLQRKVVVRLALATAWGRSVVEE